MWLRLRKTARRGRADVPSSRRRIRSCRFCREAPRVAAFVIVVVLPLLLSADLAGLASLAADHLAGVPDALALVGLRLPSGADAGGNLADELLVDPEHGQLDRAFDLEADAVRRDDLDGMAVPQVELQLVADLLGAVADARDLEALPVAGRDAHDHVVDERPGQAVELLVLLEIRGAGHEEAALAGLHAHPGRERAAQGPLGARHGDDRAIESDLDARGHEDRLAADARHRRPPYQTYARTSPPSWALRACAPVMIPWLVLTMTMPRPPRTRGMSVLRA